MSTRVTDLNLTIIPGKSIVTGEGNGKIGKMEELHTANKETIVEAVNEVKATADTAQTAAGTASTTAEEAKATVNEVKTAAQGLRNDVNLAIRIARGITAASLNIQAENVTYYSDILPLDKPDTSGLKSWEIEEEEEEDHVLSDILDALADGYTCNRDNIELVTGKVDKAQTTANAAKTTANTAMDAAKQVQSELEAFRNEINSMIADEKEF